MRCSPTPARTRRLALRTAVVAAAVGVLTALPGASYAAGTGPDYEMPFGCGQSWTGSSRANHSPSSLAVDWNRPDDLGDVVTASAAGVVTRVADLGDRSYGKYVIVDHGSGRTTLYAHLLTVWTTLGQSIDQGTVIGQLGSTGGSTGPHLHFEERYDGTVRRSYFHRTSWVMGQTRASRSCGDVPAIGDWDGNGTANVGVWRRGSTPAFVLKKPGTGTVTRHYGRAGDEVVTGDWDGDRVGDLGVRRPGTKQFLLRTNRGVRRTITLGRVRDVAVTGDWNGNGTTEVGVWNPATRVFTRRAASGATSTVTLGAVGDRPVTGDWNGDGRTDLGVFTPRTNTFTLRTVTRSGTVSTSRFGYGTSTGLLPVSGDWNGDGKDDVGVWNPATAGWRLRVTPKPGGTATTRTPDWGLARG